MRVRLFALLLSLITPPALAQDRLTRPLSQPPGYSWAGFYFGGHLGYQRSPSGGNLSGYTGYAAGFFETGGLKRFNLDPNGLFGGVQLGANAQFDRLVVGVEADASLLGHIAKGQSSATNRTTLATLSVTHTETLTSKTDINWLATFRARLGYAVLDRLLIYGTAGLAMSQIRASAGQVSVIHTVPLSGPSTTATNLANAASSSWTRTGWAAGFGAEWAFSRSLSLRGEYLHYSLGDQTLVVQNQTGPAQTTSFRFRNSGDLFRIGLNSLF
ncbi:MAG TPA: outer membrane beta-barrel protein [Beijerinckiaceae bacterium]|nr:outer membrane beta-barrel protein [Beijerinckiaceae bacterium]